MIADNRPAGNRDRTCIISGCDRPAIVRGLCRACIASAYRLVADGKTTMDQLQSLGLVKPANNRGCVGAFLKAFKDSCQNAPQ